ncbi:hypothetical protein QTP88_002842 [Uroleucon formosanum]
MSLVEEVCVCGKMKALMNSTNWQRHTKSCKKRKSVLSTAKLSTFFKSSRNVSDKDNTDSEQCIFDSIPNDDVIDSNLVNENLDKLCTTCVVSKDIIEVSSVSSTTENVNGSNVESYLNTISTIFESYPNDPALIPTSNISDEQFSFINSLGPCQPLQSSLLRKQFPKRMQGERLRSFHDEHYFKKLQDGSLVKRMWMSYSPSVDKVYCIACKLFGTSTAKKNPLAKDGINDWKHISRRILCHEASSDHLQAVLRKSMYNSNQRVDVGLILESSNAYVAENREVVKIIFETIIYLARQNISFRGHDKSLTSLNKGNFLEMLKLLSKHHALLSCHLRKIEDSKNRNRLTFLSNVSQNTMICILGELIRSKILKSVKSAQVFSVMIDTTTDISNLEQFSLVLRFVNDQGMVEERLVALKVATDSTGKGMFNLFCDICETYGLDWKNQLCAQSYDGAAVMQGQYSGLRTLIQEHNPRAVYIWCFAHTLNLIIVDTCDSCTETRNFFGYIQSLKEFMAARKRTALFMEHQKTLYPNERARRMKNFSTTRWTSHHRVIEVVFEKYKAILNTLEDLSNISDRSTGSLATTLLKNITSFSFVSIMFLTKTIFEITTPLSKYLQSPAIDFMQALVMVDSVKQQLTNLRTTEGAHEVLQNAKQFAIDNELDETQLPEIRLRKRKRMFDEISEDEIISNPVDNFKSKVYFLVIDKIIMSITTRFEKSKDILKDLSFLTHDRLMNTNQGKPCPDDMFNSLKIWIPQIDQDALRIEYTVFSKSFLEFQSQINPDKVHNYTDIDFINDNEYEDDSDENHENESQDTNINRSKKTTPLQLLQLLNSFDLITAFPNLFLLYKHLCTIPTTSVSCERSFSKLKLIKSRLRSTMAQSRLESLILISCEKDLTNSINIDEAIDKLALTSDVMKKSLLFK